MPFHDFLARCQANAVARVERAAVETLAYAEKSAQVFRGNADAVVANRENSIALLSLCAEVDLTGPVGAKLERVSQQILEQQHQLCLHGLKLNGFNSLGRD